MEALKRILFAFVTVVALLAADKDVAQARTKLAALPERANVAIRLDNKGATLIEEERIVTLQKGMNILDFSWKGVSIDEDSIIFSILSHPDKVRLISVSYPPNESALVWNIYSEGAFDERVRISYLLSNIDSLMAYTGITDTYEQKIDLKGFLVVRNFSGEDFSGAKIVPGYGKDVNEDIAHEETRQVQVLDIKDIPVKKVWLFDSSKEPWDPVNERTNVGIPVYYYILNDKTNGLGNYAMPRGKVRLYQKDGHGGNIFLGEDYMQVIPIGEKMKVYIGDSRDIVVTQKKMDETILNERWKEVHGARTRVMYDSEEVIKATMENRENKKAALTMREHLPREWEMLDCNMKYKKTSFDTIEFEVELPPHGKEELNMHYIIRNIGKTR
ncbi:MAG: hypothetical protein WA666_09915 [Nitrospirota bacterium]